MSAKTDSSVAAALRESTLDLLSRQWRAIGGATAGGPVKKQVDLEVLCLASLALERHEPRLLTALVDWVALGSALVSVQRLSNLSMVFPHAAPLLGRFARVALERGRDARWRPLAKRVRSAKPATLGAQRPLRQRSAGPALLTGPALALRMRAAFGVGVKSDLIAFLLGQQYRVTVSAAAAELGYTVPPVFRALQDLQMAGLVRVVDAPAAAEYAMPTTDWSDVLGGMQFLAPWGGWRELLSYVCAVLDYEDTTKRRSVGIYARGATLRELAESHAAGLTRSRWLDEHFVLPESAELEDWRTFHNRIARRIELEG